MAEITKITTPMLPKENVGAKYKPVTDQAFDLTDPTKVHKTGEDSKVQNQAGGTVANENMGRAVLAPVFRDTVELVHVLQRMVSMLQMGISTTEVLESPELKGLLESLYLQPDKMLASLLEQDKASVLFKGEAFDALRDIISKFPDDIKLRDAVVNLLKSFDHNVNAQNATRTILQNSYNLLDSLFSRDKAQFESYLDGLTQMLLPQQEEGATQQSAVATEQGAAKQPLSMRETAVILKNNLLPLLGEIVVKYNQNENIRNTVMTIVHNIVRVDQGSPESLERAVHELMQELKQVANVPQDFEQNLMEAVKQAALQARELPDEWMSKMNDIISNTLRSPELPPATVRQAEMLLFSILQNKSSFMDVLHYVLPMQAPDGSHITAELYVDPDSGERSRRAPDNGEASRKLFLAFESERHGAFEISVLQTGRYIDFSMWCPGHLVEEMQGLRRGVMELATIHGYTMGAFAVDMLREQKSVADVFPKLLDKKAGIDVRV